MENKRRFPIGLTILMLLATLGAVLMAMRFIFGLGAVSNLSDGRPWGLWKTFNVYAGITMAAAGFTMAATAHIFNLKKFHVVSRLGVLIGLLGYIIAMLSLLVEIGLPAFFYRVFYNFQIESPLWEVIWAIMIYTVILVVEFGPAIFERLHWRVPEKAFKAAAIPAVVLGIAISTGHQSSLGTILVNMPDALHPLWYTPFLPILFLISVLASGPATVIVAAPLAAKIVGFKIETNVMSGLAKGVAVILAIYLVGKIVTLAIAGNLGLIATAMPQNLLWLAEVVIGIIIPMVIFVVPSLRNNRKLVWTGALLVVLGIILNRFDVTMFALAVRPGYTYFPTWMEIGIAVGLFAWALLLIWLAVKFLPVFEHHKEEHVEVKA